MGGAGVGQRGMSDGWMVSLLGSEVGWWEAFFNIIFYIQLWVRAGCGYAFLTLVRGRRSIVLNSEPSK